MPSLPELAVRKIWSEAIKQRRVLEYFPDNASGINCDRTHFWTILSTLNEQYVVNLIEDVRRQRHDLKMAAQHRVHRVQLTDEWVANLLAATYQSCKYSAFLLNPFIFAASRRRNSSLLLDR